MRISRQRFDAIRTRRLVPHPIPCNLVKIDGVWVERPWINSRPSDPKEA